MGVVGDKIYLGDTPVSLVKDNYFVLANPYSEQPAGPTYQFRNVMLTVGQSDRKN